MNALLSPELPLAASEMLEIEDLATLATTCKGMEGALELASKALILRHRLEGMELFWWKQFKSALFQQVRQSIEPQVLLRLSWCAQRKADRSSLTCPLPIVLDSSLRFFIQFRVSAAKALNGTPSIGILDADQVQQEPICWDHNKWFDDLSRPRCESDTLSISCNPYTGIVHAADTPDFARKVLGNPVSNHKQSTESKSFRADLGWRSGEDAAAGPKRHAIRAGVIISEGTLEFVRAGENGWERSGILCDSLPAKVLCGAFLFNFVGEAIIAIEKVCTKEFPEYISTKPSRQGGPPKWTAWPTL